MRHFKFLRSKQEPFPLHDEFNVYENMAVGLVSWCQRMNLNPIGYQHQFDESDSRVGPGHITRNLVINDIQRIENFLGLGRRVNIVYEIYDPNGYTPYSFHIAEDVFDNIMRRYENL